MSKECEFAQSTIAIVGLGLMGGSLAMALRGRCRRLIGIDRDRKTLELALERGVVDEVHSDPGAGLPSADIVILATPISTILTLIQQLPQLHPGPAIVLDIGSTKVEIMNEMAALPPEFDPVGGHPMCGKETSGLVHADSAMYQGAPFALTALERTSEKGRRTAEALVGAICSVPLWLDPDAHDSWVASTSHLPYVVAVALVGATALESSPLVGPGFIGATRLASSNPEIMADILVTNREKVSNALRTFRRQLEATEAALVGGKDDLIVMLQRAKQKRDQMIGKG